jgi:hypothetical protein
LIGSVIHIEFLGGVQAAPLQRSAPHSSCNSIDM